MARTAAEQRRFDEAQQDEQFLSWVEMNEAVLELEFDEVDDLPEQPWDGLALDRAEAAALEIFASAQDCFTEATWESSWHFVRFIGQTFVDAFEGHWVNLPGANGGRPQVAVDLPFGSMYVEPIGMLTSAMSRRTGTEWSRVFGYAAEDYATYLEERRGG